MKEVVLCPRSALSESPVPALSPCLTIRPPQIHQLNGKITMDSIPPWLWGESGEEIIITYAVGTKASLLASLALKVTGLD